MVKKNVQSYDSDEDMDARDEDTAVENGGEEEEEEEFEIEQILDAKHGTFPEGRIGYLVKWKGFSSEDNSWVDEQDAQGAAELIEEFWRTTRKDKKSFGRKSDGALKPKQVAPKARQISAEVDAPSTQKKRGRPSKATEISDDEEEPEAPKPKKTKINSTTPAAKKSTASASAKSTFKKAKPASPDPEEEDEDDVFADMRQWKNAASWEHIVDGVDTVERTDDGKLHVYFTLNKKGVAKAGGRKCREESSLCKDKFPLKLLEFYETNLRWRMTGEGEESEE